MCWWSTLSTLFTAKAHETGHLREITGNACTRVESGAGMLTLWWYHDSPHYDTNVTKCSNKLFSTLGIFKVAGPVTGIVNLTRTSFRIQGLGLGLHYQGQRHELHGQGQGLDMLPRCQGQGQCFLKDFSRTFADSLFRNSLCVLCTPKIK